MRPELYKTALKIIFFKWAILYSFFANGQYIDTICKPNFPSKYMVNYTPNSKYNWILIGGLIASKPDSNLIYVSWGNVPGVYDIKVVEIGPNGCYGDTVKAKVIIKGPGSIKIFGEDQLCNGEAILLSASHPGYSYIRWNTGESKDTIIAAPTKTNRFYVIGYDAQCGNDTSYKTISVLPKPSVQIVAHPKKPRLDEDIYLTVNGYGAVLYKWYYKGESAPFSVGKSPVIKITEPGIKEIICIVDNGLGCSDTVNYKLVIGDRSTLFVPNAFTPNNDNLNDVFRVLGTGIVAFQMEIFDRWGKKVFGSADLDMGWDGTFNGEIVQDGSYVVVIRAMGQDGKFYSENTSVMLMR